MSCALTQDYTLDCRDAFGGIKTIYLMEWDNATTINAASGVVTGITKATGKLFRKYALIHQTASVDEQKTGSRENGTSSVKQTVKFPINKQTVAVRNEIELLSQNRLLVIALDNNGTGWIYGKDNGLMLTTGDVKSGVKLADRNGYELTFEGEEKELAYKVDSTTMGTLQIAGS
jgi:hypothetical protein